MASPALTRLYSPEDFGVVAVFTSLLGVVSVVASLRYEQAVPLPTRDDDAYGVLLLALWLVAIASCLAAFLVWAVPDTIINLFDAKPLRPYLWLLPIGTITTGTYQALSSWSIRQKAFGRLARTKLNQGIGGTGTQIAGGLLAVGPVGLIAGQLLGQSAGVLTLARQVWPRDRSSRSSISTAYSVALRYKQFPIIGTPAALLNSAGLQLPALLLASLFGIEWAGWYLLSRRVIGAPLDLIGRSVGQVYFAEAAETARASVSAMRHLFLRYARRLLLLGLPPVAILGLFSPALFKLAFGVDWGPAGHFAQLLSLMFLAQFVVSPLSQTFIILEHQGYLLGLDALKTVIALSAFVVPHALGSSAATAVWCYSLGMFVYYGLGFVLSMRLMNRLSRNEAT